MMVSSKINERIESEFIQAVKQRDVKTLNVLRLLKAALKNESIALIRPELTEEEVIKVLRREAKKRLDSIAAFKQGNRPEMAAQEAAELEIIKGYLPPELSDEQILGAIEEVIRENNFSSVADFGKIMKLATAKLSGQADGSRVSALVKQVLAKNT